MRYLASLVIVFACGKHGAAPQRAERGQELEVSVTWPGATTTEVATGVANPIEEALAHVDGIAAIHTRIAFGGVATTIELAPGTELDAASSRVHAQIAAIADELPIGVQLPTVSKAPQRGAVLRFTLTGEASAVALRGWIDHAITALEVVPDVGRIGICGGATQRWLVAVDPIRLRAVGKTLDELIAALRAHAFDTTQPLPPQLADAPFITDVALISQDAERDRCTALDRTGTNAIVVTIYPAVNADVLALRAKLEAALQSVRAELPPSWVLDVLPRTRPIALGVAGIDLTASPNALAELGVVVGTVAGAGDTVVELGARDPHIADVHLVPASDADAEALERAAIRALAQVGFTVLDRSQLVVRIAATSYAEALEAGDRIAAALEHAASVHITARVGSRMAPHITLDPDRPALARVDIDYAPVLDAMRVLVGGLEIRAGTASITTSSTITRSPPIVVALSGATFDPAQLGTVSVRSAANGTAIPLSALVAAHTGAEPEVLLRENRQPYVDVQVAGAADAIRAAIANVSLPLGSKLTILPAE